MHLNLSAVLLSEIFHYYLYISIKTEGTDGPVGRTPETSAEVLCSSHSNNNILFGGPEKNTAAA